MLTPIEGKGGGGRDLVVCSHQLKGRGVGGGI